MEKPKRPLSSFNLFYRYKRSLLAGQGDIPEETIKSIISCPAGLEDDLLLQTSSASQRKQQRNSKNSNKPSSPSPSETNNEIRRNKIRTALEGKILPSDTTKKRRHRKAADGPSLSFVEMGRMMTESWKSVDPYAKQVFDDLALEGKVFYRDTLKEYYRLNPGEAPGGGVIEEQQQCGGDDDDGVTTASPTNNNNVSKKKTASSSKKMGQTNNKKVTVHKVSRCVKRASSSFSTSMSSNNNDPSPIKSMMNNNDMLFNRGSMEPLSVDFGTSSNNNDGLFIGMMDDVVFDDNEGPLRPKAPRRHTCPNPEDIARLLANSGFGPGPISPTTSSGRKQAAYGDDCHDNNSMQPPFPRQPYSQFGDSHQFPQPPSFDNHDNTWNELDVLEPLSISPTNNINNVASTGYRHHHHHQGVNEGKLPITSTTTTTTTTASIDHQPQGYGNEWRLSASLSRPTYHRSASLPSGAASMNMNSFIGADLRMKVANNRIGSPIMMTMGSCCDTHDTHNHNNLPSPPPLTPVSQSSGSGRSLLSDVSIHHHQRQMYHQQQFFQQYQQQQQHYEQQLQQKHNEQQQQQQQQQKHYEHQQQQQQQHRDDNHGVHFKTTGLTSQDPFDNFHPIHHDDGYDAHNIPPRPASAFFHHHKEKVNDMMQNNIQTAVAVPAPAAGDVGLLEGDQVDFLDDYFDNPKFEFGRGEMNLNSEDVRTFFDAMD